MLVKPALGGGVGQREMQPDGRLGAGLVSQFGSQAARPVASSGTAGGARQHLVMRIPVRACRTRRLTRLDPASTRRQGHERAPLGQLARSIRRCVRAGRYRSIRRLRKPRNYRDAESRRGNGNGCQAVIRSRNRASGPS